MILGYQNKVSGCQFCSLRKSIHIYLSYSASVDKHEDVGMRCGKSM